MTGGGDPSQDVPEPRVPEGDVTRVVDAGPDPTTADMAHDSPPQDASVLTATSDRPDAGWRRLSARMLLVHPVQELRRLAGALIIVIVVGRGDRNLWPYVSVAIVVAFGFIRWFTTSYRVTPTQVQVRRGLLRRSTLSVPRDRVRSVDVTSNLMHRMLGLARLTIGTGLYDRKKQDEGLRLDALTTAAAVRLRDELLHQRDRAERQQAAAGLAGPADQAGEAAVPLQPPAPPRLIARLDPAWVRYAPLTLSGLVTIGVFVGFLANVVNQTHVNPAKVGAVRTATDDLSHLPLVGAILVVLAFVIVAVALLSAGGYLLTFWNFELTRQGGTLHVTRGLLTRRATTIEERRLRGAEISEPFLLRLAHGARAMAITTGLRVGRGADRGGSVLLPAAPAREVDRVVSTVMANPRPPAVALLRHGPRARRRRFTRAIVTTGALTGVLALLWHFANWPVGFPIGGGVVVVLALPVAFDRYRNLGHALIDGVLVTRQGSLIRRRYMLETAGIIGWNERMSFFQRRAGLVTLVATTAAGRQRYAVIDVSRSSATALADAATPGLLTPFLVNANPGEAMGDASDPAGVTPAATGCSAEG